MRLIIEGWRSLPHSYGVVDRFLCLALCKRPDVELFHRDVPFINPGVKPGIAVSEEDKEANRLLAQVPTAAAGLDAGATLRLYVPLNLRAAPAGRTLVFGTAEFGTTDSRMLGEAALATVNGQQNLALLTPSQWSRSGLIRGGADPDKIVVIRHGFDPVIFQPVDASRRDALRRELGWHDAFVFLNVGAMTANKGIFDLLKAFAALAGEFPQARLVLKGLDSLYPSASCLDQYRQALSPQEMKTIEPRLIYLGQTMSYGQTAALYQAADAYVSPYRAEGFNLPVLEAAACGLPVICTGGGPTDEFTDPSFALRIASRLQAAQVEGVPGAYELVPNREHLVELMRRLLTEAGLAARCRAAGPPFVKARFTWEQVAGDLLAVLADPHALAWQPRATARPSAVPQPPARSTPEVAELHARASQAYQAGNAAETARLCREILRREPLHLDAVFYLGVLALDAGRGEEALLHFHHISLLRPESAPFQNALGEAYRALGRNVDAARCFREAVRVDPLFAAAHNALGQVQFDENDLPGATASFRAAIGARPQYERAHLNLGRLLQSQGDLTGAADAYIEALRLRPDYAIAHNNLGAVRLAQGKLDEAAGHFRQALRIQPQYPEALFNLGGVLQAAGDPAAARGSFEAAIRLRPEYPKAHHGLGRALEALGEFHAALAAYRQAVQLKPDYDEAYESLGSLLLLQPDWNAARAALERAIEIRPGNGEAFSKLVFTRQVLCDWRSRDADSTRLWDDAQRQIAQGLPSPIIPFYTLTLPWPPARQLAVARSHSQALARKAPPLRETLRFKDIPRDLGPSERLRVGYLSGEFRDHAVSHLMQGVFGLHDRQKFEIFAYSFGADDRSTYRQRIASDCDYFRDLQAASLADSARRIHADQLHLLIDLQGYTGFSRMSLMALRPAAIQVSFLGFAGTSGADFIDYLIGDPVVTPARLSDGYSEKIVTLPHCYLPMDNGQAVAASGGTRAEHGLPARGAVLCAFNNSYKIEPDVFDLWMRILAKTPGSVLWLSPAATMIEQALRREAEARNIAGQRLVFARKVPAKAEHLARHRLADLFLDTLIYNGHTTACDALWAGLPVLSCPGDTFASRVGASLLTAAGLPELIATDIAAYERQAIELARHPDELLPLRDKLAQQHATAPLFDTPRFVRNLERAYQAMWNIYAAGTPPQPIEVSE